MHGGAAVQDKAAGIAMHAGWSIMKQPQAENLRPVFQLASVSTHLHLLLLALRDCCSQHALPRLDNVQAVASVGCPGNHIALPILPQLKRAH